MNLIGEVLGTFILILLGNGVVASCILGKTKAENSGWLTIVFGWGIAVTIAVYVSALFGPAHLNPAVTVAMASIGEFAWADVPGFILAQFAGAILASVVLFLHFYPHWKETKDSATILGTFATGPAIRHTPSNVFGEVLGTAVLVIGILAIGPNNVSAGLGPIIVGFIVLALGFSLGATTGYAVNPARDLGPRIAHALLPIPNKGDSDWSYSWIPVVGPLLGGVIGATIYNALLSML